MKRNVQHAVTLLFLFLFYLPTFAQQPTLEWAQHYKASADDEDSPLSIAVDAEGNSYVAGVSQAEEPVRSTTIKYSPSGQQLWAVQPEGNFTIVDIALDSDGGVFVTGYSNGDYLTIRYDATTGKQTWVQHYDGTGRADEATAITVDDAGGVYVTGRSLDDIYLDYQYATIRYDAATGQQTWVQRYGNELGNDYATAIAVDNMGGVYVTGSSYGARPVAVAATVRYDAATGEQTWVQQYQGGFHSEASAIAVDKAGGVYVTGYSNDFSYGSGTGDDNFFTTRYAAATGEQTWSQHYDGTGNEDRATDIAVDDAGGVYVTGRSIGPYLEYEYATIRYDASTGDQDWVQRYGHPFGGYSATAIAVDNTGGVYVTGTGSGVKDPAHLIATIRYDATTGEQVWVESYTGTDNSSAWGRDIAVDNAGSVYVTGISNGDFVTIKYSQCPKLAEAAITGSTTAAAGTSGSVYSLSGTGATSFTWNITDSDGNMYTDFTGQGTNSISVDWPSRPDLFKISLTYRAGSGCPSTTSVLYVHVFDPEAGFVTGGGWYESPANPDYEFMQESRRAHLSLVARYSQRNEKEVQGSTRLLLQAGSFTFRSTSYEAGTLVITDNSAFVRGLGTVTYREGRGRPVNDEREFGFLVAATDGDFGAGAGQDRFRLQIYVINEDGSQGAVVYDNQAGCPSASLDDNAEACTVIGGGNITIHKKNTNRITKKQSLSAGMSLDKQELEVYPTAVSDRAMVSFSLEHDGNYTLELYDMKGALVKRIAAGAAEAGRQYEQEISVEGMGAGLYLARLTTGTKVQTVKLIVQR
ncbi:T9SS C-terminal target domain-containing protein [Pontibacter diazotrophicus]|uniref:T9SS C-terminal target domain-containing protein n=1 Tax=Pontibacter diazotrophicus TaxID=1400979 RepID=A0A3D8L9H6_9BACT|nr:SBBP repeat-containing protein [Pontibacter diazotrophicus]RDV13632.1 T9SS C-terminal target domain-containing protein [Pontibacter diazotrophicus]